MMGSLMAELEAREAAARGRAEALRARIAELTEQLAGVEEVVLPVAYRDVLEVFADAARPLRASCCPPPWPSGWASSRPQTSSSTWASSSLARCAGTGFSRLATSGLGATHSASSIAVCTGNQLGFGGLFARLTSWRCSRHRPD